MSKVYLIPNRLGESESKEVIPEHVVSVINELKNFVVESEKTARRNLRSIGFTGSFDEVNLFPMGKHAEGYEIANALKLVKEGTSIGLFSEAGMPGIADPGTEVVRLAHERNLTVVPLVGPSSILLALISSGMNGQFFSFHGYLPKDRKDRVKAIRNLENDSRKGAQIFMETPFRNDHLLEDVLANCSSDTKLCIATDITLPTQEIKTKMVRDWKKAKPSLNKRPTVFVLG